MSPLFIIIGILVGYYARSVSDRLNKLVDELKYKNEARQTGVVRPDVRQVSRTPTDSDTGAVRSLTPEQFKAQEIKNREERARNL